MPRSNVPDTPISPLMSSTLKSKHSANTCRFVLHFESIRVSRSYTIIGTNVEYLQSAIYLCSSASLCSLIFSLNDTPSLSTYLTLNETYISFMFEFENTKKQFTFHDNNTVKFVNIRMVADHGMYEMECM